VIDETELRASVLRALHRVAPDVALDRLDPAGDLRRQADLDSFDFLRFVAGLHEDIGVDVPEADYPHLDTVNGVVAYLGERLGRD
jgi:acyl carrier protein